MFIQVRLLKGFPEPLLYEVPSDWQPQDLIGKLVRVPIQTSLRSALVINQFAHKPADITFTIKQAHAIEPFPNDPHYEPFLKQLAMYYQVPVLHFMRRIQQFLVEKEDLDDVLEAPVLPPQTLDITLTDEQQQVVDFLTPYIDNPSFEPTVLHGVTGSGKTEVYKQLIVQNFNLRKNTLLMLPEVTLALQFETVLRKQLPPDITIFSFHSATSPKNKRALWQALLHESPVLIIGVHLPILLPLPKLGLIIVDEEHETGYQEKKHPKVNTKEAAIWRAKIHNIPVLLGSATPSLSSLHNVNTKGWHFFQLQKRFAGAFPQITKTLLTDGKQRKNFWISTELYMAIKDRLQKKEQAIVFLNRRGFSFFVQCKSCSFIFQCKNCSVSLTLHEDNNVTCHYCALSMPLPNCCPQCKKGEDQFLKKGIGTQQVVTILQKLFPTARIARADLDVTLKKKSWQLTLQDFEAGNIDILVGTQTITKGYNFPNVTLVGVLWADLNLHFPVFNAAETTLQQLIQVAGRAGRQRPESLVIVQAMVNHPIFQFLHEVDYLKFYQHAMETRQLLAYPPYARFVEIELKHTNPTIVDLEAARFMNALLTINESKKFAVQILGPSKPPVHKIKNTHARKVYIKGQSINEIIMLYQAVAKKAFKSQIYFTPNPVS